MTTDGRMLRRSCANLRANLADCFLACQSEDVASKLSSITRWVRSLTGKETPVTRSVGEGKLNCHRRSAGLRPGHLPRCDHVLTTVATSYSEVWSVVSSINCHGHSVSSRCRTAEWYVRHPSVRVNAQRSAMEFRVS